MLKRGEEPRYVFPTRVGVNRCAPRLPLRLAVFPTRVGVNRSKITSGMCNDSFPHPRGGEPRLSRARPIPTSFSPPAWG